MLLSYKLDIFLALLVLNFFGNGYCEPSMIFSTKECTLTEPVYNHKFDFGLLHSDFGHQVISDKGDIFEYNICGNLTRTCNGRSNVSACLKRDNKEYILGTQHALHYRNGRMFFTYTNGSRCDRNDWEYQLHVILSCDYTLDKNQSQVTAYSNDACSFYIVLETPHACLPEPDVVKSNTCSVKDPKSGHTYDLLPLSDFNYRTTDHQGSQFVINICKPVLYAENAMCPPESSICFISSKSTDYTKRFYNYGTVQANPTLEDGKLVMRHTSNTFCNSTDNYTSIIHFYCDKDVKNAELNLFGVHGCIYEFSFFTPLACDNLTPCTTITNGNQIIDMSKLKDQIHTITFDSKNYTFSVCSSAGSSCLENDGSCVTKNGQSNSLGVVNTNLRYEQSSGLIYLLYENGASCQLDGNPDNSKTTKQWSTKIEFICANNQTKDNGSNTNANKSLEPKIIENSNCQLLVQYPTPMACFGEIKCKGKAYVEHSEDGTGEEDVDLTPLINVSDNYEADIETSLLEKLGRNTKIYINVCRPLISKSGLGCRGGTAACMAEVGPLSTPEKEQSLGFPLASLVAVNRTYAQIRYLHGDKCPSDEKSLLSSNIDFYCKVHAGKGTPILESITDCFYQFRWVTNVICPPQQCNFNAETCELKNDDINISYNLKTASFTNNGRVKLKMDKNEFSLNVCGVYRKAIADYSQSLVNIFFTATGPCGGIDGSINVQMRLVCSAIEEKTTSYNDNKLCHLIYTQRTPEICKFLGITLPSNDSSTTTDTVTRSPEHDATDKSNHPAERTGSIGLILTAILSLTFFVACIGILSISPERRNSISRCFRSSTTAVRYSRVRSNEEANLLLEPNGEFTDSDDDELLL